MFAYFISLLGDNSFSTVNRNARFPTNTVFSCCDMEEMQGV